MMTERVFYGPDDAVWGQGTRYVYTCPKCVSTKQGVTLKEATFEAYIKDPGTRIRGNEHVTKTVKLFSQIHTEKKMKLMGHVIRTDDATRCGKSLSNPAQLTR